jgi:hypothetical protein
LWRHFVLAAGLFVLLLGGHRLPFCGHKIRLWFVVCWLRVMRGAGMSKIALRAARSREENNKATKVFA